MTAQDSHHVRHKIGGEYGKDDGQDLLHQRYHFYNYNEEPREAGKSVKEDIYVDDVIGGRF